MSTPERALVGLMKMTGLRQIEAAQHLEVSRSRLAGWLAGYSPIPDEMVLKIYRLVSARLGTLGASQFAGPAVSECRGSQGTNPRNGRERTSPVRPQQERTDG